MALGFNLRKGLVGHWTMNNEDTNGGTLYDSTPQNRHGDLRNGVSPSANGIIGEAYSFDGNNDFVRMPQDSYEGALDEQTSKMSLSCWVYPTGLQTNSTNHAIQNCWMAHSSSAFNDNMEMGIDASTNDIQVYFDTNGSDSTNTNTGVTAPLDVWTHIVVTMDLSGTPTIKVYKNGELGLTDTNTWSNTNGTLDKAGAEFTLGASRSFREPYTGRLSDARIYNRVLSASEARALYNMRSQRYQFVQNFHEFWKTGDFSRVNNVEASIVQNRVFRGSNSAFSGVDGSNEIFTITPNSSPSKPNYITYRNQETSSSTGSGMRIKNGNGNYELGLALDNPQWDIEDGNGFSGTVAEGDYNEWTKFTTLFNWEDSTFDVEIIGPDSGVSYEDTGRPLINGENFLTAEFWNYNSTSWGDNDLKAWFDDILIVQ